MALRNPLVPQPHLYMSDTSGRPLDGGKVYFGEPNKDPELYPINVFLDETLTVTALQPIRTKNGFMIAGGNTVEVYAGRYDYSLKVLDNYGRQVYYIPVIDLSNPELEKVKFDTGITVTPSGIGVLPRSLHSKLSDTTHVNDYGDFAANPSLVLQKAIDNVSAEGGGEIHTPKGVFEFTAGIILKEGVYLKGEGSGLTKFTQGTRGGYLITTPNPEEKAMVVSSDLNEGDMSYNIANTCDVGDYIKISSDRLFTKRWTSTTVRDYYTEAEMFKVAKGSTSSNIVFEKAGFAICNMTENAKAVTFKPTPNMGVSGITLHKSSSVVNGNAGLFINKADGFKYDDIVTENYDESGIQITKSIGTLGGNTHHLGGNSVSGEAYGTMIGDGSKDTLINSISGNGCRHVIAGGGSGWAIPAHNTVKNIKAVNSTNGALDTHGCTAYFHYESAQVDCVGGMSGLGHTLTNVVATGSSVLNFIGNYEGGKDILYQNILALNHGRWYDSVSTNNCTYDNIEIRSDSFSVVAKRNIDSHSNTFRNIKLVCQKAANASSVAIADSCHTTSSAAHVIGMLTDNCTLDGLYLEGFPNGIAVGYPNVTIRNVEIRNSAWTSTLGTNYALININTSDYADISNVKVVNTNTSLTYNLPALAIYTNKEIITDVTLRNINNSQTPLSCRPYKRSEVAESVQNLTLNNVNLLQRSTIGFFLATTGNYVNQNLTTETYTKN